MSLNDKPGTASIIRFDPVPRPSAGTINNNASLTVTNTMFLWLNLTEDGANFQLQFQYNSESDVRIEDNGLKVENGIHRAQIDIDKCAIVPFDVGSAIDKLADKPWSPRRIWAVIKCVRYWRGLRRDIILADDWNVKRKPYSITQEDYDRMEMQFVDSKPDEEITKAQVDEYVTKILGGNPWRIL